MLTSSSSQILYNKIFFANLRESPVVDPLILCTRDIMSNGVCQFHCDAFSNSQMVEAFIYLFVLAFC